MANFLQDYTSLDKIGNGSFASVYKVRHDKLGYIRAVKVLNDTILSESSKEYQKFLDECRLLLRLGNGNHPNIVHVYQPALRAQKAFVEMDYIDGEDLNSYVEDRRRYLPVDEVRRLASEIGSALSYCHYDIYECCMDRELDLLDADPDDWSKVVICDKKRQELVDKYKVIHNDLHSGNVMRRKNGSYVLLDFGLSLEGLDDPTHPNAPSSRRQNGAPEYKAPEKWDDQNLISESTDIYSFGIILYKALAGNVPFPYDKTLQPHVAEGKCCDGHMKERPAAIEPQRRDAYEAIYGKGTYKKDYPDWLERMIMKCLEKDPRNRYRNGREFYDELCTHQFDSNPLLAQQLDEARREIQCLKEALRRRK